MGAPSGINGKNIFELFALWASWGSDPLDLLLEFGTGLYDPDEVLMCFLYSKYKGNRGSEWFRLLGRILQAGADAKGSKYQVTPLQIVIELGDYAATEMLLKAGARLEYTGDSQGIVWVGCESTHLEAFKVPMDLLVDKAGKERKDFAELFGRYGAITSHGDSQK